MILLYVTCKDEAEAKEIGQALVEKKLIACANYFPIKSIYEWEGKVENDNEYVLILKTTEDKYEKVRDEVTRLHSYEIPCILKLPIEANKAYANWVKEVTKQ